MSQYCQPSDITLYAINPLALQGVSLTAQTDACIAASSEADGYLVDRYPLPYSAPFPIQLVMVVAQIAAYRLIKARGFSPEGADQDIIEAYYEATYNPKTGVHGWLSRVKRQEISIPDLIYTPAASPFYNLPAVRTGGPRARCIRGWT